MTARVLSRLEVRTIPEGSFLGANRTRAWLSAFAAFAMLLLVDTVEARCGRKVVSVGDHQTTVLKRCGAPDYASPRLVRPYEWAAHGVPHWFADRDVWVDEWVYDRGPGRFPELYRFYDGRVIEVEVLEKP